MRDSQILRSAKGNTGGHHYIEDCVSSRGIGALQQVQVQREIETVNPQVLDQTINYGADIIRDTYLAVK